MKEGKLVRLFLSIILVSMSCHAQLPAYEKSDLEHTGLKGQVKSVLYSSYIAIKQGDSIIKGDEKWENAGSGNDFVVYNESGYEIEAIEYFYGPTSAMRKVIKRDSLNREVEEYRFDSQGQLHMKNINKYNASGQLVEGATYDMEDSSLSSKITFIYDSKGNKIEEKIHNYKDYFTGGENQYSFYFEYDKKNKVVRQTGGQAKFEHLYLYDKNGNEVDEKVLDPTGRLFTHTISSYDSNGYIAQRQQIDNRIEGQTQKECFLFEYDAQGNQIRRIECDGDCKPISSIVKAYDDDDRIIEYLEVNNFGVVQATYTYKYKVDQHGNWTHKYVFLEGKPTYIIEQIIEYYN